MSTTSISIRSLMLGVITAGFVTAFLPTLARSQEIPPVGDSTDVEVLTRGPVHEAFAEVAGEPQPGLVVPTEPPAAIDEVPPEFKPEDGTATWIPGYWGWDDERNDFFWVSGVWRVPPPDMRWVAGYWSKVDTGWQWTPGFWIGAETREVRYYDAPPASLEIGPTSVSPGDDYFWNPGYWNYYDVGYRWRPGYWAPFRTNWIWCPARYSWTPAGCVYIPGYWDYRFTQRGCLYSSVYFRRGYYTQPGFIYRPGFAINVGNLFVHLWVRPNYCHFYYGNYYGGNYGRWGYTPWCNYRPWRGNYDPVLNHLQCQYRQQGIDYAGRLDGWNRHYNNNVTSRPPRNWNEQVRLVADIGGNPSANVALRQNIFAVDLNDSARREALSVKLARLDDGQQRLALTTAREARELGKQRIDLEKRGEKLAFDTGRGPNLDLTKGGKNGKSGSAGGPQRNPERRDTLKLPTVAIDPNVDAKIKERIKLTPPKLDDQPRETGRGQPSGKNPVDGKRVPDRVRQPDFDFSRPGQPKVDLPTDKVPDIKVPGSGDRPGKPDRGPKPGSPRSGDRGPRSDVPRVDAPPLDDSPRVKLPGGSVPPREDREPKVDKQPRPDRQPKVDKQPVPDSQPRFELPKQAPVPRDSAPADSPPRVKKPKPEKPTAMVPRTVPGGEGRSRIELPRGSSPLAPQPRIAVPQERAPRVAQPRVQAPKRQSPRSEAPVIRAPKVETPHVEAPRVPTPRTPEPAPQGNRSGGGSGREKKRK